MVSNKMAAHYVDGPLVVGSSSSLTTIKGNITISDTTFTNGDMVYANSSNILARIPPGPEGQVLTFGGGNIPGWGNPSTGYGFSARKTGTQTPITSTPTIIRGWSTSKPCYDASNGSFDAATGVFTSNASPSVNKLFFVSANISFRQSNNSSSGDHNFGIYVGGSLAFLASQNPASSSARSQNMNISAAVLVPPRSTIDVRLSTLNGSTLTVLESPNTCLSIFLLSNQ